MPARSRRCVHPDHARPRKRLSPPAGHWRMARRQGGQLKNRHGDRIGQDRPSTIRGSTPARMVSGPVSCLSFSQQNNLQVSPQAQICIEKSAWRTFSAETSMVLGESPAFRTFRLDGRPEAPECAGMPTPQQLCGTPWPPLSWPGNHSGPCRLKVFFSQHGTPRVARVYVDFDGFALVGIRPSLGIIFVAKRAPEFAHLLFRIAVNVGQRSEVAAAI